MSSSIVHYLDTHPLPFRLMENRSWFAQFPTIQPTRLIDVGRLVALSCWFTSLAFCSPLRTSKPIITFARCQKNSFFGALKSLNRTSIFFFRHRSSTHREKKDENAGWRRRSRKQSERKRVKKKKAWVIVDIEVSDRSINNEEMAIA